MFESLMARVERAARRRAKERCEALADRARGMLPRGIEAEAADGGVRISGRRLVARLAVEPGLRWLLERMIR